MTGVLGVLFSRVSELLRNKDLCRRKMLQNEVKHRGENVILEMVKPMKNKGYEFLRTHIINRR